MGTPQARWRLITQSGRPSTIAPRRLRPFSGTKRVASMAFIASSRSVGLRSSSAGLGSPPSFSQRCSPFVSGEKLVTGRSMAMNHCGVQR